MKQTLKFSFPREKRKVRGDGSTRLYAVICKFERYDNLWAFADFWGKPYTSRSYAAAREMKKKIQKAASPYEWPKENFSIVKITI